MGKERKERVDKPMLIKQMSCFQIIGDGDFELLPQAVQDSWVALARNWMLGDEKRRKFYVGYGNATDGLLRMLAVSFWAVERKREAFREACAEYLESWELGELT